MEKIMEKSSKFLDLYKSNNYNVNLQEKRRQELLNEQKKHRNELLDNLRGIQDFVKNLRYRKYKAPSYSEKYDNNYTLQLSEWFKEKPINLENWYLVPCPKGKRCLVISSDGFTEVYTKNGKFIESFHSMLPGDGISRQTVTILDCIFINKTSTFYVLDVLVYSNQDFINCETQFRFFWIKSKLTDDPMININVNNDYSFIQLQYYDFEDELAIQSCLSRYPQWTDENLELDGFLFYHKEASYTCGTTPLVGWLFGFMIPEILQINVNEEYMKQKPDDYVDALHYIIQFDEKMTKRNGKKRRRRSKKMELEDSFEIENVAGDVIDDSGKEDSIDVLDAVKMLELDGNFVIEEIEE